MEENEKNSGNEKNLKLQTYVGAEDKEKYLFLKERLTAGADIPDSQVLKLIINRLHALTFLGEFYCFGEQFYYYSNDEYREAQKNFVEKGFHPNEQDFENVTNFVKSIL